MFALPAQSTKYLTLQSLENKTKQAELDGKMASNLGSVKLEPIIRQSQLG